MTPSPEKSARIDVPCPYKRKILPTPPLPKVLASRVYPHAKSLTRANVWRPPTPESEFQIILDIVRHRQRQYVGVLLESLGCYGFGFAHVRYVCNIL